MRGDDIWRRVDQLNFRIGDELTSPFWRRDDQGDELICNKLYDDPGTTSLNTVQYMHNVSYTILTFI